MPVSSLSSAILSHMRAINSVPPPLPRSLPSEWDFLEGLALSPVLLTLDIRHGASQRWLVGTLAILLIAYYWNGKKDGCTNSVLSS